MKGNQTNPVRTRSLLRWFIILVLVTILILITGFEPLSNWLGQQAENLIALAIIFGLLIFVIYLNAHNN